MIELRLQRDIRLQKGKYDDDHGVVVDGDKQLSNRFEQAWLPATVEVSSIL